VYLIFLLILHIDSEVHYTVCDIRGDILQGVSVQLFVRISSRRQISFHKTIQMFFEISYRGRLPFRGETIQLSTGGQFYCLMPDRKLRWNRSGYYKPEANLSPAGYSDKKLNTNPLQNITPL
jgi:hypothetical protein